MDNNDSKQPQQTGGLKLMTVFIAVLGLHVLVIGGFTVYHLMSGGNDADVATIDKKHDNKPTDVATATTTADKPATPVPAIDTAAVTPTTPASETIATEVTSAPATTATQTPAPATPAPATVATTAPAPAKPSTPAPAPAPTPIAERAPAVTTVQPTAPLDLSSAMKLSGQLAPPPELLAAPPEVTSQAPAPALEKPVTTAPVIDHAPALSSATPSGPVHMPPAEVAPPVNHNDTQHHEIYTVKITDSWKKIAKEHHVTVAALKDVNHVKGDTLHTGQKLIIPGASGKAVAKSEAEAPVKSDKAVLHTAVLTTTTVSSPHTHFYTIEKGDTLGKIAHKFGTTKSALISANDIADPTKLTVGHKLKIPSKESRSAGNTPPVYTAPVPAPAPPRVAEPVDMPPAPAPAPASTSNISDAQGDLATFTP